MIVDSQVQQHRAVGVANLTLFSALLGGHLLTNVYYHTAVNRAFAGRLI
jgi:hypothetical protein